MLPAITIAAGVALIVFGLGEGAKGVKWIGHAAERTVHKKKPAPPASKPTPAADENGQSVAD